MTRRDLGRILAAGTAAAPSVLDLYGQTGSAEANKQNWTRQWDRALIEAAATDLDRHFDAQENMLKFQRGAEYNYHSALRGTAVHSTRDSISYALVLLEAGGPERVARAVHVIDRTIALQDADPKSKFYGIWSYFLEEPPAQMKPADFNWADFNGAQLLMIEARHGGEIPTAVRARMIEAIRHAANSIRKRNVTMAYTNIAVQGTFVTLAAATLLKDDELSAYAHDRLHRFAKQVDLVGSFDEYNSPTYLSVTLANLTRMRMVLKEEAVLALAARIEERAWKHLGQHWHSGTRQLAGPMSRCYATDIGSPMWLQKALGGTLAFATLDEAKRHSGDAEAAMLDFHCPVEIAPLFLTAGEPRQHREVFRTAAAPVHPVQGTTWLEKDWCLGSVNRGNFWVQSRPLVAYWGGPRRPAHYVQPRLIKDDYDFSSGLLYSVQERGWLLGLVNFQTDGGDKHPSLDRIKNGEFTASRFRLRFDIAGLEGEPKILVNGKPGGSSAPAADARLALDLGGAKLCLQVRKAMFGQFQPKLSWGREGGIFAISVDFLGEAGEAKAIRWADLGPAYATVTLAMSGVESQSLAAFDAEFSKRTYAARVAESHINVTWGELGLGGHVVPAPLAEHDRAFSDEIGGKAVPQIRLSEDKLVA